MSYRVRTDSFEGPFDLLLYLVSRQKVDIGAINITQIADQYLAEVGRMQNLDLTSPAISCWLPARCWRSRRKACCRAKDIEVEDDIAELAPSEARDMLVERLLEYKQYKNAAAALHARFVAEGRMHPRPFGPEACFLNLMPDFLRDVSLDSLALLAARALARREVFLLESERHRCEAHPGGGARARHPSAHPQPQTAALRS